MFDALWVSCLLLCLLLFVGYPDCESPDCAFPPALLESASGQSLPDPLAADPRPQSDGKRLALLKILASLLQVGGGDLWQRKQQRRMRVLAGLAAGSLTITLVTIGLAISAHLARQESELRRDQAEDLITFMLTELRSELEPVGRLDILDAVGNQAEDYFSSLGDKLTAEDMLARVMALRQIGEVRK